MRDVPIAPAVGQQLRDGLGLADHDQRPGRGPPPGEGDDIGAGQVMRIWGSPLIRSIKQNDGAGWQLCMSTTI